MTRRTLISNKEWTVSQQSIPDSNIHGANMVPTWGRQDPGWPHVGHTNLAIWDIWQLVPFQFVQDGLNQKQMSCWTQRGRGRVSPQRHRVQSDLPKRDDRGTLWLQLQTWWYHPRDLPEMWWAIPSIFYSKSPWGLVTHMCVFNWFSAASNLVAPVNTIFNSLTRCESRFKMSQEHDYTHMHYTHSCMAFIKTFINV